jgi:hypothetical protein
MGERNQERCVFVISGTKADRGEMETGEEKVDRVGMWDPRINHTVVFRMVGQS